MDLSVIIINYNTVKLTRECIESVFGKTKKLKLEVIVVDNNSHDGSVVMLRKLATKYPITVIANSVNAGFGGGNNQGMKRAKGRYILLLNTDTLIHDNILSEMVDYMDENPDIGVSTCALKNADGSLQGTGGYFPTLPKVFYWMFFLDDIPLLDRILKPFHPMHPLSPIYKGSKYFESERDQDWITGAFFLARADLVKRVGNFSKDYFMYVEEVDYCKRVKDRGFKVVYLPRWEITHYGGASSTSEFPILSEIKGLKIYYKKHMPAWQLPVLRVLLKVGAALRLLIFGLLKGRGAITTYAKAFKIA